MSARSRQLLDTLNADLSQLVSETKKKSPALKLMAERAILRLRGVASASQSDLIGGISRTPDILQTVLTGCADRTTSRGAQLSVSMLHALASNNAILPDSVDAVLDALWMLMDAGVEELRVLQCVLALTSGSASVHGPALSRAVSLCFRLHFSKDPTAGAIAAATLRQIVTMTFERVVAEDTAAAAAAAAAAATALQKTKTEATTSDSVSGGGTVANVGAAKPTDPRTSAEEPAPGAGDAFLLFQDLCLLTAGEAPHWLQGVTEMTRTSGLELIETAMTACPALFTGHPELGFLLKERVCSLVIKLFSPGVKHGGKTVPLVFPVTIRLLRIIDVLIQHFYEPLATEAEIFLSMLIKFLEAERAAMWQRVAALEVVHSITRNPALLTAFCRTVI